MNRFWYSKNPLAWLLLPLSLIFITLSTIRRSLYKTGIFRKKSFPVPIIIVGNINVGGTGKTPLVIWLDRYLKGRGYLPGIVSRGYGGSGLSEPCSVEISSNPDVVGDEPWLLAKRCKSPVVINKNRPLAVEYLLNNHRCDIVISDDGLQHYALSRDIEIVVIDGARRFGNGLCLPAGPLRECKKRIEEADLLVNNGGPLQGSEYLMKLQGDRLESITDSNRHLSLSSLKGRVVHAVAGIGNPSRFFAYLRKFGLTVIEHPFPDHHRYLASDFEFADEKVPILMTEKDAMKCRLFAKDNYWYLPVDALMTEEFATALDNILTRVSRPYLAKRK